MITVIGLMSDAEQFCSVLGWQSHHHYRRYRRRLLLYTIACSLCPLTVNGQLKTESLPRTFVISYLLFSPPQCVAYMFVL